MGGFDGEEGEHHHKKHHEADAVALEELKPSTVDCLRKAFNLLDSDCSGFIELSELDGLLKNRKHISQESVADVMKKLDTDGDVETLSFTEFVAIMVVTGAVDDDIADKEITAEGVARSFSGYAHRTAAKGDDIDVTRPLWEYEETNKPSCRLRWARKIDSNAMQIVTLALVVLDVIAVILEVLLEYTQGLCPGHGENECCDCAALAGCTNMTYSVSSSSHRFLSDDVPAHKFETCDDKPWTGCCHDGFKPGELASHLEVFLHYTSVTILFSFFGQLLLLIGLYGGLFFKNAFYVLDLVIIVVSLGIELGVHEARHVLSKEVAGVTEIFTVLLAMVLFWRVIRILHGLIAAAEKSHHLQMERELEVYKKFYNRIHNTKMLLRAASHGASHFEENNNHLEKGLSEEDKKTLAACREGSPPSEEELEALLRRRQEHRQKHEEFLEEMSSSLENMHSQMSAHEKLLKHEVHEAEHHNHASSLQDHGHGHGHGGHDDHGHAKTSGKVHPVDDEHAH